MGVRERDGLARRGAVAGAAAYTLGFGVVVVAGLTGLLPEAGLWTRVDGPGYLLVHQASHLPVWQFRPQWAFVPVTLCLAALLVGTGFAVTTETEKQSAGFQAGQAVVIGYFPLTLAATVLLLATNGAVTAIRMIPVLLLVGLVVPALLGGLGGELAVRYR
ncbi:hypothetical protein [Halovenus halobia]|uniref:hypothetical protein n=1 Tax=Halovenus halobia TaxID=3396622 RepID=UPI003F57038B